MRHERPHWVQLHSAIDSPGAHFRQKVCDFDLIETLEDPDTGSESKLQAWPSNVADKIAFPVKLIGCLALLSFLRVLLTVDPRRDSLRRKTEF